MQALFNSARKISMASGTYVHDKYNMLELSKISTLVHILLIYAQGLNSRTNTSKNANRFFSCHWTCTVNLYFIYPLDLMDWMGVGILSVRQFGNSTIQRYIDRLTDTNQRGTKRHLHKKLFTLKTVSSAGNSQWTEQKELK